MGSRQTRDHFEAEPSKFIEEEIKAFVHNSPANRMPPAEDARVWLRRAI